MPKKLTLAEFIDKANKVHDCTYDYSKSVYINSNTKITIICKVHGEFEQRPHDHIDDRNGCPKCGILRTAKIKTASTEDFIKKSIDKYGDKYVYDKTIYKNCYTSVQITCKIHGDFSIVPSRFLSGLQCPGCNKIAHPGMLPMSFDIFLKRCKEKHGNRFTYTQSSFTSMKSSVDIFCIKHNIHFTQNVQTHLNGKGGCPKCKADAISNAFLKTNENFITDARITHGELYNYDLVEYKNSKSKIVIQCKVHGKFQQIPNDHLLGCGCPKCAFEISKGNYNKTLADRNKEQYKQEKCDLYLLEFNNDDEKFIKIGISKEFNVRHTVLERNSKCKIINLDVLSTNLYDAIIIEKDLIDTYKTSKYKPSHKFPGHTECFSIGIVEDILKVFSELRA